MKRGANYCEMLCQIIVEWCEREKQRHCRLSIQTCAHELHTETFRLAGAVGGNRALDFRSRCAWFFKGMRNSFSGSSERWARKSGLGEKTYGLPRLSELMHTLSTAVIANYSMIYAHSRLHWRRWWCFWILFRCKTSFHANLLALSSCIHLMNSRLNAANKVFNDARVIFLCVRASQIHLSLNSSRFAPALTMNAGSDFLCKTIKIQSSHLPLRFTEWIQIESQVRSQFHLFERI